MESWYRPDPIGIPDPESSRARHSVMLSYADDGDCVRSPSKSRQSLPVSTRRYETPEPFGALDQTQTDATTFVHDKYEISGVKG